MEKLEIKNFGPIQDETLIIKDFMVFIGPQASGKSTIAKSIFFFKSLRDDLIRFARESAEKNNFTASPLRHFEKIVRQKFLDYWGSTRHLTNILLNYQFTDAIFITITLESTNSYVNVTFSNNFKRSFNDIIHLAKEFGVYKSTNAVGRFSKREIDDLELRRQILRENVERLAGDLFNERRELLFIPAGRSLLATLSTQIQNIEPRYLDYLMREFVEYINNIKPLYSRSISELIRGQLALREGGINGQAIDLAEIYLEKILKGKYSFDSDGEKIFINNHQYVKLNFASSGQQESLWILYLIFNLILQNQSVLLFIEEPEAHLYPIAQKQITELITLVGNLNNSSVVLTTHSPYILSSLNNLLYANKVSSVNPIEVHRRIDRQLWLDSNRLFAARVENGTLQDVLDSDLQLIKSEMIDDASQIMNADFDYLFDLDTE